jgi:hypothetical protein
MGLAPTGGRPVEHTYSLERRGADAGHRRMDHAVSRTDPFEQARADEAEDALIG